MHWGSSQLHIRIQSVMNVRLLGENEQLEVRGLLQLQSELYSIVNGIHQISKALLTGVCLLVDQREQQTQPVEGRVNYTTRDHKRCSYLFVSLILHRITLEIFIHHARQMVLQRLFRCQINARDRN